MNKILEYQRQNYEVHTSSDGDKWRIDQTYPLTSQGLQDARQQMKTLLKSLRNVRLARTIRNVTVLDSQTNLSIASDQQIKARLEQVQKLLACIHSIRVNEGFDLCMGTLTYSPTRISVSVNVEAMIGKCPSAQDHKLLQNDPAAYEKRKADRRSWNIEAESVRRTTLDSAESILRAANISYTRYTDVIHVQP